MQVHVTAHTHSPVHCSFTPKPSRSCYAASDICFVHDGRAQLAEVALCMQGGTLGGSWEVR